MSSLVILSGFIFLCRRFPILMAELLFFIINFIHRKFLSACEFDESTLIASGFKNLNKLHYCCYRRGEVEFYTTISKIGPDSFRGWRVHVRYAPDIYLEIPFIDIWIKGTETYCEKLAELISKEISLLQLAMKETKNTRSLFLTKYDSPISKL